MDVEKFVVKCFVTPIYKLAGISGVIHCSVLSLDCMFPWLSFRLVEL